MRPFIRTFEVASVRRGLTAVGAVGRDRVAGGRSRFIVQQAAMGSATEGSPQISWCRECARGRLAMTQRGPQD